MPSPRDMHSLSITSYATSNMLLTYVIAKIALITLRLSNDQGGYILRSGYPDVRYVFCFRLISVVFPWVS